MALLFAAGGGSIKTTPLGGIAVVEAADVG
jgi:hypothetical protein